MVDRHFSAMLTNGLGEEMIRFTRIRLAYATIIALSVATVLSFTINSGNAANDIPSFAEQQKQLCQQALAASPAPNSALRTWLNNCVAAANRVIPTSTPSPTVVPTTAPPTTTPPVTTAPPTPTPTPTPGPNICPQYPLFVTVDCVGLNAENLQESNLKVCNELDGDNDGHLERTQTFDRCVFKGGQSFLRIKAANIVIKNSLIHGCVATHYLTQGQYMGLKLINVEFDTPCENYAPVSDGADYSCLRCYVHGASTGLGGGSNVTIEDSYVTSMFYTTGAHQAAIGMNNGRNIVIRHNTLNCFRYNVPPGPQGCSSALSLYDEGPLDGVLVEKNLFNAAGEYCTYTGGPTGKNVKYFDNVFGMLWHQNCGNSGPVHSWYPNNVGYEEHGNKYSDGRVIHF